jgi:UDP-GlcNAc:undecaprenyl-phosphate/decaprenyl-phosphate GlcNAc-1-phosphate transferase
VELALSCAWTGTVATAFNLLDNIDGAAAAVGAAAAAGAGVLATLGGDDALGALAFALLGSCLAFLRYNLAAPARIFLGDGGSLPLGFAVAAVTMSLPLQGEPLAVSVTAALLLAAVPIADTSFVLVSRLRRRVPVTRGGRDHITHRLLAHLPSERVVAALVGALQALLCAAAVAVVSPTG